MNAPVDPAIPAAEVIAQQPPLEIGVIVASGDEGAQGTDLQDKTDAGANEGVVSVDDAGDLGSHDGDECNDGDEDSVAPEDIAVRTIARETLARRLNFLNLNVLSG